MEFRMCFQAIEANGKPAKRGTDCSNIGNPLEHWRENKSNDCSDGRNQFDSAQPHILSRFRNGKGTCFMYDAK